MHLVFVCTGNICRSPTAERLTRAFAVEHAAALDARITASSAGTRAVVGSGIDPSAALVLSGLGGEPAGFSARSLDAAEIERADLVLPMTTRHRAAVLQASPRAMSRTFTLPEAAVLLREVAEGSLPASGLEQRGRALVGMLGELRAIHSGTSRTHSYDIPDPIGRSLDTFQSVGEGIADALMPLLQALLPVSVGRSG